MDPHALVWSLALGIWTPTHRCGPTSWGYGLPCFGVNPRVGDMDSYASVWPLELGRRGLAVRNPPGPHTYDT